MSHRWALSIFAAVLVASPLAAQGSKSSDAPVVMPAGDYVIDARDSTKKADIGILGWAFVLKGNGTFNITTPDGQSFGGTITQKNGVMTYTDQGCTDGPGVYTVKKMGDGYVWDFQSEACKGRNDGLVLLLFRPGKPKKP